METSLIWVMFIWKHHSNEGDVYHKHHPKWSMRVMFMKNITLMNLMRMCRNQLKRGLRPRRKVEHWTPKGDCKVAGIKERNQLQFY